MVVTGSRHIRNGSPIWDALDTLAADGMEKLAQGGARGADRFARLWAVDRGFPHKEYAVDEMIDGRWPMAGPRRNERMLDCFKPNIVIAFPYLKFPSRGTKNCIMAAVERGIKVVILPQGLGE